MRFLLLLFCLCIPNWLHAFSEGKVRDRLSKAQTYYVRVNECRVRATAAYPDKPEVTQYELSQALYWGEKSLALCNKNIRLLNSDKKAKEYRENGYSVVVTLRKQLEPILDSVKDDLAFVNLITQRQESRTSKLGLIEAKLQEKEAADLTQKITLTKEAKSLIEELLQEGAQEEARLDKLSTLKKQNIYFELKKDFSTSFFHDAKWQEDLTKYLCFLLLEQSQSTVLQGEKKERAFRPISQHMTFTSIQEAIVLYQKAEEFINEALTIARTLEEEPLRNQNLILTRVFPEKDSLHKQKTAIQTAIERCSKEQNKKKEQQSALKSYLDQLYEEEMLLEKVGFTESLHKTQEKTARVLALLQELNPEEKPVRPYLHPTLFFQNLLQAQSTANILPLDHQKSCEQNRYFLSMDRPYRFLWQNTSPISAIAIHVYEDDNLLSEEIIPLPQLNTLGWERYLQTEGMVFIPQTALKKTYGLDLRFSFLTKSQDSSSMLILQKGSDPRYRFVFSLDGENPLYECRFSPPPPWQLETVYHASYKKHTKPETKDPFALSSFVFEDEDKGRFPELDQFVVELNSDPIALAQYVQAEIALVDPFLYRKEGLFLAPGIQRNAYMTFLEKQGSPWEQCQLLVYLLKAAGYQAVFIQNAISSLPKDFVENMLYTKLPEEETEGHLRYPFVALLDQNTWISLFPWMKEISVFEGYDLYSLMPEKYASAHRWIHQYLNNDADIQKHKSADGEDGAGTLFIRSVEEELQKKGLCLTDVGIHRLPHKRQCLSWKDFPRPSLRGSGEALPSLDKRKELFAVMQARIASQEDANRYIQYSFFLEEINCLAALLYPSEKQNGLYLRTIKDNKDTLLPLTATDRVLKVDILYQMPIENMIWELKQTLSLESSATAALCIDLGGTNADVVSQGYQHFAEKKDNLEHAQALLKIMGATYFDKCNKTQSALAELHKINPLAALRFGFAKFVPHKETFSPQVDMCQFNYHPDNDAAILREEHLSFLHLMQYSLFSITDISSNEHRVLEDIFQDPDAISTTKLLKLAHTQNSGDCLVITPTIAHLVETLPEIAQEIYFPNIPNLNIRELKESPCWQEMNNVLKKENPLAYAYITPGPVFNSNATIQEEGALIIHPTISHALLSNRNLLINGGMGTPIHYADFVLTKSIQDTLNERPKLGYHGFSQNKLLFSDVPTIDIIKPETRSSWKWEYSYIGDPVDVVSGAFYIDELDLFLPGPLPLEIKRNYSNQNLHETNMGPGWKLSLNPFLVEQEGKRYIAELDGSVIVYVFNQETDRWEVSLEENDTLYSLNQNGANGTTSPFHSFMKGDTLYGSDGSKRLFENGLLKFWISATGDTLSFLYTDNRLSRIENSAGGFCGLRYNHEGRIREIFSHDGRIVQYSYNVRGDLVKVRNPNGGDILYDYDGAHQIIRQIKPYGNIVENTYDEKHRVIEQRVPLGPKQTMAVNASFVYEENSTRVYDAAGAMTLYKIFQKQIYKIVDPLGYEILQSWYIDRSSWFDAKTETLMQETGQKGWPRSPKYSIDRRGLAAHYTYDDKGNPSTITIEGDDLTGDGTTSSTKYFLYNENNLCVEERFLDQCKKATYDARFPYKQKRQETYSHGSLLSYTESEYNSLGQIVWQDVSGTTSTYEYDTRGNLTKHTTYTGTKDPDCTIEYAYNNQGQCIRIVTPTSREEREYDISGNQILLQIYAPSGTLLSEVSTDYNLSNNPFCQQDAAGHLVYTDYHAYGVIKAKRQISKSGENLGYVLYDYDTRGNVTEEIDQRGFCTTRSYDPLCRLCTETKEGLCTTYTYEGGGAVSSITTPSGAITTLSYTTLGQLKEQQYPDGTKDTFIYDLHGRIVRQVKQGIAITISYDDVHHRIHKIHEATGDEIIEEYNQMGSLIKSIDQAGCTTTRSYDLLNRIIEETSPSGETTKWSYEGDTVFTFFPGGEKQIDRYENNSVALSQTYSKDGVLLEHFSRKHDPKNNTETVCEGELVTITHKNGQNLPIAIQKENQTIRYEYDLCGNCIVSIDEQGNRTEQEFDPFYRLTRKKDPSGSYTEYTYDEDGNLSSCSYPNGLSWQASYDPMHRKVAEFICAKDKTTQAWTYTYENGLLVQKKDPLNRIYTYKRDSYGRVIQESVANWTRVYEYNNQGYLILAEQIKTAENVDWLSSWFYPEEPHHSRIERVYDEDGRIAKEAIYLNGRLHQKTLQSHGPSHRHLQTGKHSCFFSYQNKRLTGITAGDVTLSYDYTLQGRLSRLSTPYSTTTYHRNTQGLPISISSELSGKPYEESLEWDPVNRLSSYHVNNQTTSFSYTKEGHLAKAGQENYGFMHGVRIQAPGYAVSQNGIDPFGRITKELFEEDLVSTTYDAIGQTSSQGDKTFTFDPWGRLIQVLDPAYTWKACYDALGRRLKTEYTPYLSRTVTTAFFYDPQEEFQDIGVRVNGKTYWKLYGPTTCDAVLEQSQGSVILFHNALRQQAALLSSKGISYAKHFPSAYGPRGPPSAITDLLSFASSLSWHSKNQDETGLIWMGARYYDPKAGRFPNHDPIGYPNCSDLYVYANSDPVNFMDPDGRCFSAVFQGQSPITAANNALPARMQNWDYQSFIAKTGGKSSGTNLILFVNGIKNSKEDFYGSLESFRVLAGDRQIIGIYNATHGLLDDLRECTLGWVGIHTPPVVLLMGLIRQFHEANLNNLSAKILLILHSAGNIIGHNALKALPEEIRNRVIVLAIAPGEIVPEEICFKSFNYVSKGFDVVPHANLVSYARYFDQLTYLDRHPDAPYFMDHSLDSPTFDKIKSEKITEYISQYGN